MPLKTSIVSGLVRDIILLINKMVRVSSELALSNLRFSIFSVLNKGGLFQGEAEELYHLHKNPPIFPPKAKRKLAFLPVLCGSPCPTQVDPAKRDLHEFADWEAGTFAKRQTRIQGAL